MAKREASFAVKLLDQLSRPARAMGGSLARLRKQMRAMDRMQGGSGRGMGGRRGGALPVQGVSASLAIGKGADAALGSVTSLGTALAGAVFQAGALAGAMAAIGAAAVVAGIAKAVSFTERMTFALSKLTGSESAGGQAFKRAGELATTLGQNVEETTKQYAKLLAAQFSVGETENIIKLSSDLKAIGATADETSRAIMAITQIKAKGRLQTEELLQLNEAGLSLKLVFEALAKSTGKSIKQVQKAMEAGAIDSDLGVAAIQAAILKKVGIKAPGDAGREFASSMLEGAYERLKNAPALMFGKIAKASGSVGVSKLKGLVGQLQAAIDAIDPHYAALAFHQVIDLARTGVTLAKEFAGGFSDGFGEIMAALDPGSIGDASRTFRELGRNVAKLTFYAIEAAKAVGQLFNWINSDAGKVMLAFVGIAWAVFKLAGLVGSLTLAFGGTAGAMGTIGLGFATLGKGFVWVGGLIAGGAKLMWGFAAATWGAIAPIVVIAGKFALLMAAVYGVYRAVSALLDLTGGTKWLENFGASFAGPAIPRAAQRGFGAPVATQPGGHPYAGAGLTTAPSAIVKRDQVDETSPIIAAGQKQGGTVSIANLTVQLPQAAAASPRSHASALAAALKNELGGVVAVPAGG